MKTLFNLKDHTSVELTNLDVLIKSGIQEAKKLDVPNLVEEGECWSRLVNEAYNEAIKRETDQTVKDSINKTLGY